jgi:hypothetical protein
MLEFGFSEFRLPRKPRCETSCRRTSRNPDGVKPRKVEGHVLIRGISSYDKLLVPFGFRHFERQEGKGNTCIAISRIAKADEHLSDKAYGHSRQSYEYG